MIRHLLKMVWNRKRANALIALEIVIAFLVLFAVSAMAVYHWSHYRAPLGFDWESVWSVDLTPPREAGEDWEMSWTTVEPLLRAVRELDAVDSAAVLSMPLYSGSGWSWGFEVNGKKLRTRLVAATDELDRVMRLEIVRGRWFQPEDDAAPSAGRVRGVISESLAAGYFAEADPIGQLIQDPTDPDFELEVVGVMTDYRYRGELAEPGPTAIVRVEQNDEPQYLGALAVRVRPGTPAAYEETLLARLHAVAPTWSFEIEPAAAARDRYFRERLAPLLVAGLVAGFLLLMVALGLMGVLWQAVTQRTAELGIRRAQGAEAAHILAQIQGEMLLLTGLALVLGALIAAQVPLLGWFPGLSAPIFWRALLVSVLGMTALSLAASLYPSWMATRVEPAHALHYE